MTAIVPQHLVRKVVTKPWGGKRLCDMVGVEDQPGDIGETWEIFDRPDGSSAFRGGGTLRDLMARDPGAVLGTAAPTPDGRFPLLLKFIDAREALSIQVHPGAEQAAEDGDGPKNEAWFVLDAGPKARIIRGFRPGSTREQVIDAVGTEQIEDHLHAFQPNTGDVVTVPAGTIHAIGPDVVIFEVQQNSDITYRLWDWGRPRDLHVDSARRAIQSGDLGPSTQAPVRIDDRAEWVMKEPEFSVRRLQIDTQATLSTEGSFKIMTVLNGIGTLGWRSGGEHPPLTLQRGDSVLVPADTDLVFVSPVTPIDALWTDSGGH